MQCGVGLLVSTSRTSDASARAVVAARAGLGDGASSHWPSPSHPPQGDDGVLSPDSDPFQLNVNFV